MIEGNGDESSGSEFGAHQECRLIDQTLASERGCNQRIAVVRPQVSRDRYGHDSRGTPVAAILRPARTANRKSRMSSKIRSGAKPPFALNCRPA